MYCMGLSPSKQIQQQEQQPTSILLGLFFEAIEKQKEKKNPAMHRCSMVTLVLLCLASFGTHGGTKSSVHRETHPRRHPCLGSHTHTCTCYYLFVLLSIHLCLQLVSNLVPFVHSFDPGAVIPAHQSIHAHAKVCLDLCLLPPPPGTKDGIYQGYTCVWDKCTCR